MVDYARDLAPWIALGVAVQLLVEAGLTEDDAKAMLLEAIRDGLVKFRGPPRDHWLEYAALDWERSLARGFVFGPDKVSPTSEPIRVCCADVLSLCERMKALQPATGQRGTKPSGDRRDQEIREQINRMLANGEIDLARGGPTKAAKHLMTMFPAYKLDTMVRKVRQAIEARKPRSG